MTHEEAKAIRYSFLEFDNPKKIMKLMEYPYDETKSHNANCIEFIVNMSDANRLHEIRDIINRETRKIEVQENNKSETKWEYQVITHIMLKGANNNEISRITNVLNQYGANGWEVCSVELDRYLLKRKIE